MSFDLTLPSLYKEKWREAYREDKDDSPRLSSYQAPEGSPIPFIYDTLEFSGGQSIDTAEYPFFGLWSNESINQKTQLLTVNGYLRGEQYLQQRLAFLSALMIPTADEAPGFFDHPLWGRFKVVVDDYRISESADENGQCKVSLTFKRAGIPRDTRAAVLSPQDFTKPEAVALIAVKEFAAKQADTNTLLRAFGFIKTQLLSILGRVQAPAGVLTTITNEITGISNLIAQGVQTPMVLAQAMVNACMSIAASIIAIGQSAEMVGKYFSGENNKNNAAKQYLPASSFTENNKKNVAMQYLSASSFTLPIDAVTVKQAETKKATENFYRTVSLCVSAQVLMYMDDITYNEMAGYWTLYKKLENSVNLENPDVFQSITEMRSSLSEILRNSALANELKKQIERPVPLLFLSHYLGCPDDKLRQMNTIEDSLLISGEVSYV